MCKTPLFKLLTFDISFSSNPDSGLSVYFSPVYDMSLHRMCFFKLALNLHVLPLSVLSVYRIICLCLVLNVETKVIISLLWWISFLVSPLAFKDFCGVFSL